MSRERSIRSATCIRNTRPLARCQSNRSSLGFGIVQLLFRQCRRRFQRLDSAIQVPFGALRFREKLVVRSATSRSATPPAWSVNLARRRKRRVRPCARSISHIHLVRQAVHGALGIGGFCSSG
jgi:hypothetical protein